MDDAALDSRQAALQAEAAQVLTVVAGIEVWRDVGRLVPMGSYVSGLMCWRDLDVGMRVGPDFSPSQVMAVIGELLEAVDVASFGYRDERAGRSPTGQRRDERYHVPLQVVWDPVDWRLDLSLFLFDDHAHIAEWHRELAHRITATQRRAVLRIKDVWCQRPEYPDEISGFEIYRAVLDDGVDTPEGFATWLVEHQHA